MTHTSTDQDRAYFEEIMRNSQRYKPEMLNRVGDSYEFDAMESAWQGFQLGMQAARRAQVGAVPQRIEQMAVDRYKVVPSHSSMFYPCAVVAGDGQQHLYIGREVECQNMARKFTGAFLDGAFAALAAAPQPTEAVQLDDINVADMAQAVDSKEEEPVQMPEPAAWRDPENILPSQGCTYEKSTAKKWAHIYTEPLYTEHQVRQLLAQHGVK